MLSWLCIFYFEKCVTQSIKVPFENKAADPTSPELWSPCLSFSFSLSFFLPFFRLNSWSTEALWVHFFAWASKTRSGRRSASSPHWEGTWGLREQSKSCVRGFIGFLCKPRNISLFLSSLFFLLYFLIIQPQTIRFQSIIRSVPSLSWRHSSWGYPWILLGLDPGSYHQKGQEITSVDERVEKREPLCTAGESVNWYNHYIKQWGVLKKIKNRTTIWSNNSISGYLSREEGKKEILILKDICIHSPLSCSLLDYLQWTKYRNNLCPSIN